MNLAAFARQPAHRTLLAWVLALCLAVAVADALLAWLGTALMGTTGALAARPQLSPTQQLNMFVGTAGLRLLCLLAMVGLVALAHRVLPHAGAQRGLALCGLVLAASLAGWLVFERGHCNLGRHLDYAARLAQHCSTASIPPHWVPVLLASQLQYALLLVGLYEFVLRSRRAAQALHEAGLRQLSLAGELAAGRAQLLQAQIEPYFLFNSLANVRRLLRTEPPLAAAMLADLLRYLQEALPRLRLCKPLSAAVRPFEV